MAIDLYMWLSYRMYSLKKPQKIRWESIAAQLGSEYKELFHFRAKVRQQFQKIKAIWPDVDVDLSGEETLEIKPSRLLIPAKN